MNANKGASRMVAGVMILALVFLGCNEKRVAVDNVNSPKQTVTPGPKIEGSPIRKVDFNNVRYTNFPNVHEGGRSIIEPGEGGPGYVDYYDVTGDGNEEAIVVFPTPTHGTAIPYYVYIFTLEEGRLKSLWDFEAGDRGDGGVRRIYGENGRLVVELYSENKLIGRLYENEGSTSRPMKFTRAKYQFRSNKFHMINKPEIEPNPTHDSLVLMTPYVSPGS